jgi:hypothetical protein
MRTLLPLLLALASLSVLPAAAQEVDEEEDLALRQDPWTHLVVTLVGGKKVTFTRAEIAKVQYVTRTIGGSGGDSQGGDWMGRVWRMRETAPDGRYCDAVWTRQGSTNRFSGQWTCSWGARVSDTLVVQPLRGTAVVVHRDGVNQNYQGTLGADRKSVKGVTWGQGSTWTVKIE